MTETQKSECQKAYYYTDIEPTLDRLNQVKKIVINFENEGASRLTCALNMKHMDLDEIERLGAYIAQARDKMDKELERLRKYEKDFNMEFATDHNDYYNSATEVLKHSRSHMSPLKNILKKFCTRKHPTAAQCVNLDIPQKSVFEGSVLGASSYQLDLFDLSIYPPTVQGLFTEMIKFFKSEEECLKICTGILEEELAIAKDPVKSKYLLDRYRRKAYKRLKNQIMLITDDVVENLKSITPAYQRYQEYASEEGFAQGEFHKQNRASMDHLCLIEIMTETDDITTEEKALWGNNPKLVKKIRYVISHFDELLPENFKNKMMGMFEYIFCKWALPSNIKQATEYFYKHYNGNHRKVKYAGVNKHSSEYDQHSALVKDFLSAIRVLLLDSKDAELMENIV